MRVRLPNARLWVGILVLTILPLVGCQQGETDFDTLPEQGTETSTEQGTETTTDGY